MRRKVIESGYDLLVILANHLVMIGFGITIMGLFGQESHYMWLWIAMGILPIILYFARVYFHNFFLFFALHLLIPFIIFFLPVGIVPKVVVMAIVVVYVVWSVSIRLKGKTYGEELMAPMVVICALGAMTLVENIHTKRGWESYYLLLAILYIAGYFVCCFISQYLRFLRVNESSAANIPEKEIFTSGMRQTVLFMAGGVLVIVLTANIGWVSYLISWIGKALKAILTFLFSWISYEETGEVEPYAAENMGPDMGMFADEATETNLFWVILEKIVIVAAVAFIVGLIVLAIVMGFRYLWNHFHMSAKKEEIKLQSGIDIRESCAIETSKKEGNSWFAFLNNREKVRKIYRKQVLKRKTDIIGELNPENLGYMTAKECCDKISEENLNLAGNLKKVYEKARYSAEEITSEDVKLLKTVGR